MEILRRFRQLSWTGQSLAPLFLRLSEEKKVRKNDNKQDIYVGSSFPEKKKSKTAFLQGQMDFSQSFRGTDGNGSEYGRSTSNRTHMLRGGGCFMNK